MEREIAYDELIEDFSVLAACANCGTTDERLYNYWPDDKAQSVRLCEDCATECARVEKLADTLAKMPSCNDRDAILQRDNLTTRGLVNALQAHDVACAACGSGRKTVVEDRLYVRPDAVCCEEVA